MIVADTHDDFPDATAMPPGDVLVHCGDWDRSAPLATWLRSVRDQYAHVLIIHGNHDSVHRDLSPQLFEGEGPPSAQSRPPLTLARAQSRWGAGSVAPDYAAACDASDRLQRKIQITRSRVPKQLGCILRDSGVVINGWTIWGTPWHLPSYDSHPLFTADEDALRHIYGSIPPTADVVLTHGPAHGVLDRPAGSFIKENGSHRDLELANARAKKPGREPARVRAQKAKRLGSVALKERLGDLHVKLHACGHVHARQSAADPDVRHVMVGETLHVNAAVMQTLPGKHHRVIGDTNPLKALRAPVVVELTPEAGARVVTAVGGTAGGAGPSGVAV